MDLAMTSQAAPQWEEALALLERALQILDDSDAPMEIGCQLDLARARLRDSLYGKPSATMVGQLRCEMERLLDSSETKVAEFA
jgi:hypothetical protein